MRYRRIIQEYERAVEEQKLVEKEKHSTTLLYETQLRALANAAHTIQQDINAVDSAADGIQDAYYMQITGAAVRHMCPLLVVVLCIYACKCVFSMVDYETK